MQKGEGATPSEIEGRHLCRRVGAPPLLKDGGATFARGWGRHPHFKGRSAFKIMVKRGRGHVIDVPPYWKRRIFMYQRYINHKKCKI